MKLKINEAGNEITVIVKDELSFIVRYAFFNAAQTLNPGSLEISGSSVKAVFTENGTEIAWIEDSFNDFSGLVRISRKWTLLQSGIREFGFDISSDFSPEAEILIPAVMYRGNVTGKGAFPRGGEIRSFMENRTPLPSCVQIFDSGHSLICCVAPAREEPFISSVSAGFNQGQGYMAIRIPGREWPSVYSGKNSLIAQDNLDKGIIINKEDIPFILEQDCFISIDQCRGNPYGIYRTFVERLDQAGLKSSEQAYEIGWNRYRDLKLFHLLSLIEPGPSLGTAYLVMGRNNGELQGIYDYTAASFLVKSLEGALILARFASQGTGLNDFPAQTYPHDAWHFDQTLDFPELAEQIGRFFLSGEQAPGKYQDCYDIKRGIWGGYLGISENDDFRYLINARCNGEVMKSYILLYEELRGMGRSVPEFIELPKRVAQFYLDHQMKGQNAGSFGRWWSLEGEPVNSLGTNGAYIMSFLMTLEPYWEDKAGLNAALALGAGYYKGLVDRGDFFGDTLDADSYDKEAGISLMIMFLDLYERDKNREWLNYARKAADFVLTWVWQYDIHFSPGSGLGSRNFRTTGMSSVSVAHHHLDFYGMTMAYDFFRLWKYTGDGFYRDQGLRMARACRQLIATGNDLLGRKKEDLGWQPEQLNHTAWDYFDRLECMNGHFDIDIAWVTVLGLGAYQRIERQFPELLISKKNP